MVGERDIDDLPKNAANYTALTPLWFLDRAALVAVIAPNVPAIYEAHFGVPMAGAVINPVNIRLNAQTVAFLLEHSSAAVVMCDPKSLKYALGRGALDYEKFLETGDPEFAWKPPEDEWLA
ncbi:hypothetical protein C3L33_14840, partial [Rhododendron williamsianum]